MHGMLMRILFCAFGIIGIGTLIGCSNDDFNNMLQYQQTYSPVISLVKVDLVTRYVTVFSDTYRPYIVAGSSISDWYRRPGEIEATQHVIQFVNPTALNTIKKYYQISHFEGDDKPDWIPLPLDTLYHSLSMKMLYTGMILVHRCNLQSDELKSGDI